MGDTFKKFGKKLENLVEKHEGMYCALLGAAAGVAESALISGAYIYNSASLAEITSDLPFYIGLIGGSTLFGLGLGGLAYLDSQSKKSEHKQDNKPVMGEPVEGEF